MLAPAFDLQAAHRYFAAALNNRAWDLLEKSDRSPLEDDQMLHAAHGACHHWSHVGTVVNRARSLYLLANAYADRGEGLIGLRFAEQCLRLICEHRAEMADFDIAFAYECAARSQAAAGAPEEARWLKRLARESGDQIQDEEDRKVFDASFASRNWFGVD
jgi:hypothetical protein